MLHRRWKQTGSRAAVGAMPSGQEDILQRAFNCIALFFTPFRQAKGIVWVNNKQSLPIVLGTTRTE